MAKPEEPSRANDPFEIWRQMYDANERAWTAALEQAMGSREFGESSGKLLDVARRSEGRTGQHADVSGDHERADA